MRPASTLTPHLPPSGSAQGGFMLALGILLMATMALIGTAALSTSTFQRDLTDNARYSHELYYVANAGLSRAMQQLTTEFPRSINVAYQTRDTSTPQAYVTGGFDRITGALWLTPGCLPGTDARTCACPTAAATNRSCIAWQVFLYQVNMGNAPSGNSVGKYMAYYWKLTSVSSAFNGAGGQASLFTASVHRVAQ